jgi:very-short-patch-repair endonuclease
MQEKWKRARALRSAATDAERHLWRYLRRENLVGFKFRRQYPIARYIADFACIPARLVIELDGGQHIESSRYDAMRTRELEAEGFRVIRFWNHDVLLQADLVLEEVLRALGKASPHPNPPLQAGEGVSQSVTFRPAALKGE